MRVNLLASPTLMSAAAMSQGLYGSSMFPVKAKIYGVLYNQSSSVAFDETFSYWSAPKSS